MLGVQTTVPLRQATEGCVYPKAPPPAHAPSGVGEILAEKIMSRVLLYWGMFLVGLIVIYQCSDTPREVHSGSVDIFLPLQGQRLACLEFLENSESEHCKATENNVLVHLHWAERLEFRLEVVISPISKNLTTNCGLGE